METLLEYSELSALQKTKSAAEWNSVCDKIKKSRGGAYPVDWYSKVIASGLIHKQQTKWRE